MIKSANKKILVVDDNLVNLEMLKRMLDDEGYEVLRASRGTDAVKMAREYHPDLIILDIVMPDLDGGDVVNILKKHPRTRNIPVIFLSSLITKREEKFSSKKEGISFMAKPYNRDNLLKHIDVYL